MPRLRSTAVALLLPLAVSACCGGGVDERSVGVTTDPSLTLTRGIGGPESVVEMTATVGEGSVPEADFDALFRAADDGDAPVEAVAVTLTGNDVGRGEIVTVVLAVPMPLRTGDRIPVGEAVPVPATADVRAVWGAYDLAGADEAGVGLWTGTYTFPPPTFHPSFHATSAAGEIEVVRAGDGWATLRMDVTTADGTGATMRLRGQVQLQAQRYSPPC